MKGVRNATLACRMFERQLGAEKAAAVMAELEMLFPVTQVWEMRRREDMSNLGG